MERLPKGYRGVNHETLGSDILAILKTLRFPEVSLGKESYALLRDVQEKSWYPIRMLLDVTEKLHTKSGVLAMRQMGRMIFETSHQEQFKRNARCARDLVYGIDAMYHSANRGGEIGGWKVEAFESGRAELLKNTPHHCGLEEGILLQALSCLGIMAVVTQPTCFRNGDDACRFKITSSTAADKWMGTAAKPGG